jgi:hypothetical protein
MPEVMLVSVVTTKAARDGDATLCACFEGTVAKPLLQIPWPVRIDQVDVEHRLSNPQFLTNPGPFLRLVEAIGETVAIEAQRDARQRMAPSYFHGNTTALMACFASTTEKAMAVSLRP